MTDSIIERVARAMGDTLIPGSTTIPAKLVISQELLGSLARAAIQAMRTPTEAIKRSLDEFDINDPAAWPSLIDAALKEKPTEAPEQPLSAGGLKLTEPDPAFWWKD